MKRTLTVKFEILNTRDHVIDVNWCESDRYFGRVHKFAMNLTESINNVHLGNGVYTLITDKSINHLHDLPSFNQLLNALNLLSQGWPLCHSLRVLICIPDFRSNSIIVSSALYNIKDCTFIQATNQLYLNYENRDILSVSKELLCEKKYIDLFEPEPYYAFACYR